jgi:hypothetical protein
MQEVIFDIGYGITIDSLHCRRCGHNTTIDKELKSAIGSLRAQIKREVKLIKVGEGIGLRLPNEIVKAYNLKKGAEILLQPEMNGIRIVTAQQ